MSPRRVLVTGGAGYIGTHTCVELLEAGLEVHVLDDLSNGSQEALRRVGRIAGREVRFHHGDVRDAALLRRLFLKTRIDAVLHFAALKAVAESVSSPLRYFDVNVRGTLTLVQAMLEAGVETLVYSSSATVYGAPDAVPIPESAAIRAVNPYGRSKVFGEGILEDLQVAAPRMRVAVLRYFNPGGAHPSGLIGESPLGVPNNLLPFVTRVATGALPRLRIFGGDYPTPDGTGVRDYIHVVDLARGHVRALDVLTEPRGRFASGGLLTLNLGVGRGFSVLEVVRAFERVSGRRIPYEVTERRPGDVAACYADPTLARRVLGWHAEHDLERICTDAWRWETGGRASRDLGVGDTDEVAPWVC